MSVAQAIAKNAPLAVAAVKRAVTLGTQLSVVEGSRVEATLFASLAETRDLAEGVSAFFERRPPSFNGN
jgi:enoyl-CoA hydratase/carnithine racemase